MHRWLLAATLAAGSWCMAAQDGVLAHYPLDGNFQDAAGSGRHLAPLDATRPFSPDPHIRPDGNLCYGPLTPQEGFASGAVAEDFSSDISRGMTLSGFVRKPGAHNYVVTVFGFVADKPADPQLWLRLSYGRIQAKVGKGYRVDAGADRVLADGRWHHLAMVIPPAGTEPDTYAVYLDGEQVLTGAVERFSSYGTRFGLGTRSERDVAGFSLDEVKVFSRALAPAEITAIAALTGQPQPTAVAASGRGGGGGPAVSFTPTVPLDQVGTQVAPGVYRSTAPQVERHFVLAPDWLVLVNNYMDETDALIYTAYREAFDGLLAEQENREQGRDINWVRYKQRTRLWQNAYAQFSTQHQWMAEPANFAIHSADDPAYREPKVPSRTVAWVNPQNSRHVALDSPLRNCANYEIGHYAYLNLPSPLLSGRTYTVTQKDGRAATFTFDDRQTVSPALKTNQVGHLPDAPAKFAYLGAWVPTVGAVDFASLKAFEICREEDGQPVFSGDLVLRAKDSKTWGMSGAESYSGEDLYQIDFSEFRNPGRYFVRVPGLGRSYPFQIAPDALGEAFFVAARGFFHQRCGIELKPEHTAWTRNACHTAPLGTCQLVGSRGEWKLPDGRSATREIRHLDFNIIRQTASSEKTINAWGGWHDAADYDKGKGHHIPVWDLLGLYEINPAAFTDGQLNLPESGNGIPDLLDEARFGIDHWKRAQQPDGGVTGRIETFSHPQHAGMPDRDPDTYYASLPDRDSTMHYAASAAYFARLVRPFSAELSKEYLESAGRAYRWAENPANSRDGFTITVNLQDKGEKQATPKTLTLAEKDEAHWMAGAMAALNLFLATGDEVYRQDLNARFGPHAARFFTVYPNPMSHHLAMYLMAREDWVDAAVRQKCRDNLLALADEAVANTDHAPYRHAWREKKSRRWGWALAPSYAKHLILAHRLTGEEKYRAAALLNLDFHLGCNALGMSQTTGVGRRYPPSVQDIETRSDNILDPVPGLTPYGVIRTPVSLWEFVYTMPIGEVADERQRRTVSFLPAGIDLANREKIVPLWRQIGPHDRFDPLCNEFTVMETTGPVAFTIGAFLAPGWMPPDELRRRQPAQRPGFDSFYWLP